MTYISYNPSEMEGRAPYFLGTSLVVPRPIAWVSTLSSDGIANLAPHSYFNMMSSVPLIVHFTSTGVKDTLTNSRLTGEFVVNIVPHRLVEQMNLTAANFPPGEDEFGWAKLGKLDSVAVKPPRVEGAGAALECRVIDIISKGNGNMVFGEVLMVHVHEGVLTDGRVDPHALDPVGRMGGSTYTRAASDLFELKRPTYEGLTGSA